MILKKHSKKKNDPKDLQGIAESYEKWLKKKKIIIISIVIVIIVSILTVVALSILIPKIQESADLAKMREKSQQISTVMRNERVVENVVGSYRSRKDKYPTETKLLTMDGKIKIPFGVILLDSSKDSLNADNGKTTIWYQYSSGSGEGSGARIQYWDYGSDSLSHRVVYLGDATKDSEFFDMK